MISILVLVSIIKFGSICTPLVLWCCMVSKTTFEFVILIDSWLFNLTCSNMLNLAITLDTCPVFCFLYCVSALGCLKNKEVVDEATYLPHLLNKVGGGLGWAGGEHQLWYESDAATIGIQWPGNTQSLSFSWAICLVLRAGLSARWMADSHRQQICASASDRSYL